MIINIRGTSGSGKSTLVRQITSGLSHVEDVRVEGRRRPLYSVFSLPVGQLAVIGHYETACGGCDTITSMDTIFQLVADLDAKNFNVLFEGLLISSELQRTIALQHTSLGGLMVLGLNEPIEVCLASVNERRRARNPDLPPVNPKNTTAKHRATMSSLRRLKEEGVLVLSGDRVEVLDFARRALGIHTEAAT